MKIKNGASLVQLITGMIYEGPQLISTLNQDLVKLLKNDGYKNISEASDLEIAVEWTKKYKITTIPCSVFYPNQLDEKVLRVCFAKDDATLERAAEVLRAIGT
jgi:aspartate/methionine/tyrosine aminotransferase